MELLMEGEENERVAFERWEFETEQETQYDLSFSVFQANRDFNVKKKIETFISFKPSTEILIE